MPTNSRRTRQTKRITATTHIPVGLQIVVRAIDGDGRDTNSLRDNLRTADAHALRILHDPLTTLDDNGVLEVMESLAKHFGAEDIADKIAAAIPRSVTHDPRAIVSDHAVCWQNAGLYLGLCLGFRIAAGLSGKE